MLKTASLILFLFVWSFQSIAQNPLVKVITEEGPKRILFYVVNENEHDLDVMITIKGTNFRQSKARPRFIRVPATSKVHMKSIILLRGKKPAYTYDIVTNDSLSNRALRKEFELVKINPKKRIVVYLPGSCQNCDSIMNHLNEGKYLFTSHLLSERPKITEQLKRSLGANAVIDSLQSPIFNLGGRLYTKIESYDELLEVLAQD